MITLSLPTYSFHSIVTSIHKSLRSCRKRFLVTVFNVLNIDSGAQIITKVYICILHYISLWLVYVMYHNICNKNCYILKNLLKVKSNYPNDSNRQVNVRPSLYYKLRHESFIIKFLSEKRFNAFCSLIHYEREKLTREDREKTI